MSHVIVCLIMIISGIVCAHFDVMYYQVKYYFITAPVLILAILIAPIITVRIKAVLHL
jgi:hypothetical protein